MKRPWFEFMMMGMALFLMSMRISGQANLISARPGCLNYFEGDAFLNAQPLTPAMIGKAFIKAGDKMSTGKGKTELLLTPGVFLRINSDSEVQVTSLSLIDIQLELLRGEAMIEADEMTKDNSIAIRVRNASALIEKPGLYRFAAGHESSVAVISGKVQVSADGRDVTFGRGHQVLIADSLAKQSFDPKKEDDLYAWRNERSEYNAAASYQSAQTISNANYGNGYGAGGFFQNTPGWLWNDSFDSWAWIPGGDMTFFSPFGYGFFSPGAVGYAPLCYARTFRDANLNLLRDRQLFTSSLIAKQQVDTQKASSDEAQAALAVDAGRIETDYAAIESAALNLSFTRITAPLSGRIGLALVDAGNIVHSADTNGLAVIANVQPISVLFTLPEEQLPLILKALRKQPKQTTAYAYDATMSKQLAQGTAVTVDNRIDNTTGTARVQADFLNKNFALFPNQFVNVRVLIDVKHGVTLVPAAAIQQGPAGSFAYIVKRSGIIRSRPVRVSSTDGANTVIEEGLFPGEQIIVGNVQNLTSGTKVIVRQYGL